MPDGFSTLFLAIIGFGLLATLVLVLVGFLRRGARVDTRGEPAAQTWATAVPYVVGFVFLVAILLGLYWLM